MSAAVADRTKYKNQWARENLERVPLVVKKGQKAEIQAHAAAQGESVNGFIGRAIQEAMERDKAAAGPQQPQESPGKAQTAAQPSPAPSMGAKIGRVADSMAVLESVVLLLTGIGDSQDAIDPDPASFVFGFIHREISKTRNELYKLIEEAGQ